MWVSLCYLRHCAQVILKAENGSLKAKNGCLLFKVIKGRFEAKNEHFNYKF